MRNYKDESFIGQYLSPKMMREFRLFTIVDDEKESELEVAAIHDDSGYRRVREALSRQYDLGSREPNIQVWNVNLRGDRSLTLRHFQHNDRPLADSAQEVLRARGAAVGLRRAARERQRGQRGHRHLVGERAGRSRLIARGRRPLAHCADRLMPRRAIVAFGLIRLTRPLRSAPARIIAFTCVALSLGRAPTAWPPGWSPAARPSTCPTT